MLNESILLSESSAESSEDINCDFDGAPEGSRVYLSTQQEQVT
jgi:hypothetical protein